MSVDMNTEEFQNMAETMMGEQHGATLAQYSDILNDPAAVGQHMLQDASAFMLHDKIKEGLNGLGKNLELSEDDLKGIAGELGDVGKSAVGAIGNLAKNIRGAINDRISNYAAMRRGHYAPRNNNMGEFQNLTSEESVARLPGGRTSGLLPFESSRPDDEFSRPVNNAAPRGAGAPKPSEERLAPPARPSQPPPARPAEEGFPDAPTPPAPTSATDMQNAPNPSGNTSQADDANARNGLEQDAKADEEDLGKKALKDTLKGDLDATEADPELAPVSLLVGAVAGIASMFIHPHQEKQVAPAQQSSNYSVQIGA